MRPPTFLGVTSWEWTHAVIAAYASCLALSTEFVLVLIVVTVETMKKAPDHIIMLDKTHLTAITYELYTIFDQRPPEFLVLYYLLYVSFLTLILFGYSWKLQKENDKLEAELRGMEDEAEKLKEKGTWWKYFDLVQKKYLAVDQE